MIASHVNLSLHYSPVYVVDGRDDYFSRRWTELEVVARVEETRLTHLDLTLEKTVFQLVNGEGEGSRFCLLEKVSETDSDMQHLRVPKECPLGLESSVATLHVEPILTFRTARNTTIRKPVPSHVRLLFGQNPPAYLLDTKEQGLSKQVFWALVIGIPTALLLLLATTFLCYRRRFSAKHWSIRRRRTMLGPVVPIQPPDLPTPGEYLRRVEEAVAATSVSTGPTPPAMPSPSARAMAPQKEARRKAGRKTVRASKSDIRHLGMSIDQDLTDTN